MRSRFVDRVNWLCLSSQGLIRKLHYPLGIALYGITTIAAAQPTQFLLLGDVAHPYPSLGFTSRYEASSAKAPLPLAGNAGAMYEFLDPQGAWTLVLGGAVAVRAIEDGTEITIRRPGLALGLHRLAASPGASVKFPLFSLNGRGRGCKSEAAVYVHEAEFAADGTPTRLAADFSLRCLVFPGSGFGQRFSIDPVWGAIRHGSSLPLVSPRVFAVADRERAVLAGAPVLVDGGRSWSPDSPLATYSWTQMSGPAVDLSECQQALCRFAAPQVARGGASITLALTVADKAGRTDTDRVTLHVRHRRDRQFLLRLSSNPGEWALSGPAAIVYTEHDGYFWATAGSTTGSSQSVSFSGLESWNEFNHSFNAARGADLIPGSYAAESESLQPVLGAASMYWGFQARSATLDRGSYFKIQGRTFDFQQPSPLRSLGANSVINYQHFGPRTVRTTVWLDHEPAGGPSARLAGPLLARAGEAVTLDARASIDSSSAALLYSLYQVKGPPVEVLDVSVPGLWVFRIPPDSVAGKAFQFALEVEGTDGTTDATAHALTVAAPSVPPPVTPPAGGVGETASGSGGGALSLMWVLGLLIATGTLRWIASRPD